MTTQAATMPIIDDHRVCDIIQALANQLDCSALFDGHHDEISSLIPRMLGTRGSVAVMIRRAETCAVYTAKIAGVIAATIDDSELPATVDFDDDSLAPTQYAIRYNAEIAGRLAREAALGAAKYAESGGCDEDAGYVAAASVAHAADAARHTTAHDAIRALCLECLVALVSI